jgi:hypothetical protein
LPIWIGLGVVAVAGVVAAIAAFPRLADSPATATPARPSASAVTPEPVASTPAQPPPAPSASATTTVQPASGVRLEIETDPPGAEVFLDEAQVCDAAPCQVRADHNETVTLTAKKGPLTGTKKVLAQQEQKVLIRLKPPPGPLPRTPTPTTDKVCTKYDETLEMYVSVPCPK